MSLVIGLITALIIIVPLWKIFGKAGMHPALSLLVLIPGIGALIVLLILAFGEWQPQRRA